MRVHLIIIFISVSEYTRELVQQIHFFEPEYNNEEFLNYRRYTICFFSKISIYTETFPHYNDYLLN